jgi:2-methylcitrate dehydratase PrpD
MTLLPTIHLNGTGAKNLQEEYHAVRNAVEVAIDLLAKATCNARDFYPQGGDAYQQARQEREEMFEKLHHVSQYAEEWEAHAANSIRR